MSIRRDFEINSIDGNEGTQIKQYFHPDSHLEDIDYSLAQFTLESGKRSKLHKMLSSEVYYILEGEGMIHIDGKTFNVKKNDSAYVPPNSKQYIKNLGKDDLKFLCIVQPGWNANDEILLE